MGRLTIRKVKYFGENYSYESPELKDGLNIIEGPNGSGKSTFMNFIYFGLSGNVIEFNKSTKRTHLEIITDNNNYVELEIEINYKKYTLKRFINSNDITIFEENDDLLVYPIYRSKNEKVIFSDWILKKLDIEVVEVFQGNQTWKLNFLDLFRLIYHDQAPDPKKIYMSPPVDNFISESEVLRKIIFQLLIGKTFSDYYTVLARLKEEEKNKNITKSVLDEFIAISSNLNPNGENLNVLFLSQKKEQKTEQLQKLYSYRDSLKQNRPKSVTSLSKVEELKTELLSNNLKLDELESNKKGIFEELIKLQRLKEDIILEVTQIKKIIHTHEKLNLFSSDTCPYCLREVKRSKGFCVCGAEVEESQYERFFYNADEYIDILKSKQKSVETIDLAINSCKEESNEIKELINNISKANSIINNRIRDLIVDLDNNVDIHALDDVDDRILNIKGELFVIEQQIETELKKEQYQKEYETKRLLVESLRNNLTILEAKANEEIKNKIEIFNEKYNELMRNTLKDCWIARITIDDYMPLINNGEYREASSYVPIRLMYYLTMLYISLVDHEVKFPKFLLIDTPETAGIDDKGLKESLRQILKIIPKKEVDVNSENDIEENSQIEDYQIILTTGLNKYPSIYGENVFTTLSDDKRLLRKNK